VEKTNNKLDAIAQEVYTILTPHLKEQCINIVHKKTPASVAEAGAENRRQECLFSILKHRQCLI